MHNHIYPLVFIWAMLASFSFFPLSTMHVRLDNFTFMVIFIFIFIYFIFSVSGGMSVRKKIVNHSKIETYYNLNNYRIVFLFFLGLSLLNILIAGFIPLLSLIMTGNSKYASFGISGIYGFYLAYSTALGILSLYLFFTLKKRKFLYHYLIILTTMLLFFTRQNIIVLIVEGFVVYSFLYKKIGINKILVVSLIILILFSYLGTLRSGDIKVILKIKEEYWYLPNFIFWLYGYLYFSGLNLNNLLIHTSAPYYDGSSVASLIPAFIQRLLGISFHHQYYLQNGNMTVSTALGSIYGDMGIYGIVVFSSLFGFYAGKYFKKSTINPTLCNVGIYAVLFFCAVFSFFVNYWFYLPIIFQIVFICIFSNLIIRRRYIING